MTADRFSLAGRTALVTGSSRGIGAAMARAFAEAGADVAVHCAGRTDEAEKVAAQVRAAGRKAAVVQADLGAADGARRCWDGAIAGLGRVDILVLNASIQLPRPWLEATMEDFDRQMTVNVRASYELLRLAAPAMCDRGWGRILTIGSVQEAKPNPAMLVYAATKSAQSAMMRALAKQLAPQGVTINGLAPGVIDTDRTRERIVDDEYRRTVMSWIPTGRIGEPEDCVGAALLLCSDAGSYITGHNIFVDGGMSLP
ncbi:MAG: SDR family oxidoreductase [Planctomycetes bacterium]|nr:SDR family oxidoreductase [Planctomycetota bacterium]